MKLMKRESIHAAAESMSYYPLESLQPEPSQLHHQAPPPPPQRDMSREEMDEIFHLCRKDEWHGVLERVRQNPPMALNPMIMDNHIATTVVHQAITSKGETAVRAEVISTILRHTPESATIKNGYGSLPIHVIAQRNTKMDAQTKERLIFELVSAYPGALTEEGGVGKRTPLHIIFTDYISPRLTRMMIDKGPNACFKKDRKGFLPAHVACSRHCSPEKLRMLLAVNPHALYDKTNKGETIMDLAKKNATKSHPNYALIEELNRQLGGTHMGRVSSEEEDSANRSRLPSDDSAKSWHTYETLSPQQPQPQQQHGQHQQYHYHHQYYHQQQGSHQHQHFSAASSGMMMHHQGTHAVAAAGVNHHNFHSSQHPSEAAHMPTPPTPKKKRASRKRKTVDDTEPAADLLLHFSRNSNGVPKSPRRRGYAAQGRQPGADGSGYHPEQQPTYPQDEPTEFAEV